MNTLIIFSVWITGAFAVAIILNRWGIPKITTYLLAGILLSPELLGEQFKINFGPQFDLLTQSLFAFIAFLIGAELNIRSVRKYKTVLLWGTIGQMLGAILFTTIAIYLFLPKTHDNLVLAILLGAISATTAPATTIAIIDESKSKGPLTTILLGIVILDDILGIGVFSAITTALKDTEDGQEIFRAVGEIICSIGLGVFFSAILGIFYKKIKIVQMRVPLFIGMLMTCHFISLSIFKTSVLSCMSFGVFIKIFAHESSFQIIKPIKNIEELIFILFFLLAGTHFDSTIFTNNFGLITIYIIARALGKYLGAFIGTGADGLSMKVRKLVGLGLLPQAGLAIGLILSLQNFSEFSNFTTKIINIIMGSTIIYELISPFFSKLALSRAKEIDRVKDGNN